jgi:hypothetical protein
MTSPLVESHCPEFGKAQVAESISAESTKLLTALHTGKYFWLSTRLNLQIDLWFAPATPTAISFGRFRHAEILSTICKMLVTNATLCHIQSISTHQLIQKLFSFVKRPDWEISTTLNELL